jgi:leader peptidase (prepilin peptidase)/N-methyltransferase
MPAFTQESAWYGLLLFVILWATLGWAAGLGLNRIIHQLPRDLPPLGSPSCQSCSHPIPIIGWMSRPCPACGKLTGYDRTEWLAAAVLAVLAVQYGPSGALVAYSLYSLVLIAIAAIDFRHRYVYSVIVVPALLVAVILTPLLTGLDWSATLIGMAAGFAVFLAYYFLGRMLYPGAEGMGRGDIEIAALIGAMVGFPRIFGALLLGGAASAAIAAVLLIMRRRGRLDYVPYGPGLCFGALCAFFMPP